MTPKTMMRVDVTLTRANREDFFHSHDGLYDTHADAAHAAIKAAIDEAFKVAPSTDSHAIIKVKVRFKGQR